MELTFKQWLEGMKDTAALYRSLLAGVPQDLTHHPEGDVLAHVKMVRASIPPAVEALKRLKPQMPVLGNIDFSVSPEELKILALASWLHDIGKVTATQVATKDGKEKISAYGHQDPEHFIPQIEKFRDIASPQLKKLYLDNKELLDFITRHHMAFMSNEGFSKAFRADWIDKDGKLKNDPKVKLLIILMMADKMGRGLKPGETPEDVRQRATSFNQSGLQKTYDKSLETMRKAHLLNPKPFEGDVQSFIDMLRSRGQDDNTIKKHVKNKYGVDI